ncbi:hypothetical protein [uncultured Chryseobacterium sp.]|nr:hypothetical protein [uncultured Chryseobacterium sp.]
MPKEFQKTMPKIVFFGIVFEPSQSGRSDQEKQMINDIKAKYLQALMLT